MPRSLRAVSTVPLLLLVLPFAACGGATVDESLARYCSKYDNRYDSRCDGYRAQRAKKRKRENRSKERTRLKQWRSFAKSARNAAPAAGESPGLARMRGVWCSRSRDGWVYKFAFQPKGGNTVLMAFLQHKDDRNVAYLEDGVLTKIHENADEIYLRAPPETKPRGRRGIEIYIFRKLSGGRLQYFSKTEFVGPASVPLNELIDKKYRDLRPFVANRTLDRCKS